MLAKQSCWKYLTSDYPQELAVIFPCQKILDLVFRSQLLTSHTNHAKCVNRFTNFHNKYLPVQ